MHKISHLLIGIILFSFCFCMFPGDTAVALKVSNNSFETLDPQGLPQHWLSRLNAGETADIHIKVDGQAARSGKNSLMISHKNWGQSEVLSDYLDLKVGHLYRLSGWIKTADAHTHPLKRYPTSVAACLTMESLPFTNHSPAIGGNSDWSRVEILFIATRSRDRVKLNLGYNGDAMGDAWFDDISVEKEEDITAYIPMETVKWFGPAYRYDDKGWIFVHTEGKPYERGYRYGYLVANEIASYINKLAYMENEDKPTNGWDSLRFTADAFMLRKYDEEYLTEMKGIADGAAEAGATFDGEKLDLLDIVTLNSVIDIGQMHSAIRHTPHALSGKSFLKAEEELKIPIGEHKCSGFLANGPATPNGDIVFGQIFMWYGYTGVHWNIICDVVPEKGNRLVYHTYPGGIHSGADFYLNSKGIMIGETTVSQTPYDRNGTPQSNRIRKAAQYANSIDDVVKLLSPHNNGMYTNDWLIGDAKTNETAIFLLGTKKSKLWRSSTGEFPGDTKGFFWSNNNNKDDEVRKEYIPNSDNAPYDLIFSPWNRDLAFNQYFKKYNGKIDSNVGVRMWASSPINRPHACDGKITTTEMAKAMVFMAHFGKVTLRGKYPEQNRRILRNEPNAMPHLSLGYSIASPRFVTEKLQALKKKTQKKACEAGCSCDACSDQSEPDVSKVKDHYSFDARSLWSNTVYPASSKENWFISATSAYWRMLKRMSDNSSKAASYLKGQLESMTMDMIYVTDREGSIVPLDAKRVYDRYNNYRIPRIRGTFLLHQLRLKLGEKTFSTFMNKIHDDFKDKPFSNKQFFSLLKKVSGKNLKPFAMQWLERKDLPTVTMTADSKKDGDKWKLTLNFKQQGNPYHFITSVAIQSEKSNTWEKVEVSGAQKSVDFTLDEKPVKVVFNDSGDIPVMNKNFYTFSSFFNDFQDTLFVYGTKRQIEANRTITDRFRKLLADTFTETILPLRKDSEVDEKELKSHDLFILGSPQDNSLMAHMLTKLGIDAGKNYFRWQGKTYAASDDGLLLVYPNPYNPKKVVYLFIANSALQLHEMTFDVPFRAPSWALFKGKEIKDKDYHPIKECNIVLK